MIVFPEEVTCALGGASSKQQVLASASAFGAPDLDTRLPGALRKATEYQVQECPACGYCAQHLSAPAGNLKSFVYDMRYRARLEDPESPRLANRYQAPARERDGS